MKLVRKFNQSWLTKVQSLSDSGTKPDLSRSENNGIRFTNVVIIIATFALCINIIENAIASEWKDVIEVALVVSMFLVLFFLNRIGMHRLVQVLAILIPTFAFTYFYIDSSRQIDVTTTYIVLILFALFYFKAKILRNVMIVIVILAYVLAHSNSEIEWVQNQENLQYLSHYYLLAVSALSIYLVENLMREKEHLLKNTEALLVEVKDKNAELESFTFVSSHNMKSPLRTINSFASLLGRSIDQGETNKGLQYLNYIKAASERMFSLTEEILMYAKLENISVEKDAFDVSEVLDQVDFELQETTSKEFRITYNDLPVVYSNRGLCQVLFENLIENGIKYNENKIAQISVTHNSTETDHIFYIEDNGIGIPTEDQENVFDMFTRLHGKEEYEGTGIGLAICRKIISLLGGTMELSSKVGEGTKFTVHLPHHPY